MKKFEVTTVEKLLPGDRFYFLKDKQCKVFEVIEQKISFYGYGVLSTIVKQDGMAKEHVKNGREVVFLRNNNQTPTT